MKSGSFKLSIIIPCFNEVGNIEHLYSNILLQLKAVEDYEILFIDDGSTDGTLDVLVKLAGIDPRIRYINFSRNFGHQNAVKAGLDFSSGDCVISMDADMQHPPKLISEMIDKWLDGYDVVYTIRLNNKKLPLLKRITSRNFYKLINYLSETEIREGAADFRLLDRKVVEVIKNLRENYLFLRGIVPWVGFKQTFIEFTPNERFTGYSKYSVRKMLKFASSGITSFSTKPLKISIFIGFLIALVAFLYGIWAVAVTLFTDRTIPGWTSAIFSVLFIGGIQLIMIGIIGSYLGKLFIENKRRPNYIINQSNIDSK